MPRKSGKRKGGETVELILDAAEHVFARDGFKGASLQEITTRVGISQPALYNHFQDKEALYTAVFTRALQPVITTMDGFIERAAGGDPPADFNGTLLDLFIAHPNVAALIVRALLSPEGEPGRDMALDWLEKMFKRGDVFDALLNPGGDRLQTVLLHVASYGLTNAFILMQPMLPRLLGSTMRETQFRKEYKRYIDHLMAVMRPSATTARQEARSLVPLAPRRQRSRKS